MDAITSLSEIARQVGFTHMSPFQPSSLHFRREVRDMCVADKCNKFGKCWSCPPGCGSLEDIAVRVQAHTHGLLVQSTGLLEDDFDVATMLETGKQQRERFFALAEQARRLYPELLPMASGACETCQTCTYPDAPCRFPERAIPSMEAYGLVVSDVCVAAGLPYYYGPKTITYTSCILI